MIAATERDLVARDQWRHAVENLDYNRFIFVDETSTSIDLTRLYARAPRGERAFGSVPFKHGTPTTLITSLSMEGLGASLTIEGTVNGDVFTIYVRDYLCPTLRRGQIVFIDNFQAHKGEAVRKYIEEADCTLEFLPTYSPDFSPVELAIGKIKEFLRSVGARTQADLDGAITKAINTITSDDASGWFKHCGYHSLAQC